MSKKKQRDQRLNKRAKKTARKKLKRQKRLATRHLSGPDKKIPAPNILPQNHKDGYSPLPQLDGNFQDGGQGYL